MPATSAPAASRRPTDSAFYQQKLKAWQPILTPYWVILTFLAIGIPFLIIGGVLRSVDEAVTEFSVQYDGAGAPADVYAACHIETGFQPSGAQPTCTLSITVTKDMKAPVYVYYELENFYQNHRRYVKSRSDAQLAGAVIADPSKLADCDPLRTNGSFVLHPCGLIANSYFNDTITLTNSGFPMMENDISWESDRTRKFKAADRTGVTDVIWINQIYPNVSDVTNEHFIVWMRVAALPHFRKLYGRIERDIPANTVLNFVVGRNFPVTAFDGKKSLVVSTTSFLGGKNPFLGIAYMVVGALCCALALLFFIRQAFGGRRLGDTQFLVWQTHR